MHGHRRHSRGQSLVEFALVLPLLTILMLGAIDLARVFYTKVTLANASRTAAAHATNYRLAQQYGSANAATTSVINMAHSEAAPYVTLTTVSFTGTWNPGTVYTVAVATDWSAITPGISQLWGGGPITLDHTTALRHNCQAGSTC